MSLCSMDRGSESMNNKPVAWMETYKGEPNNLDWDKNNLYCEGEFHNVVPLYTHPHPDNLGLAESIIKQQQAEIEALNQRIERMIENASHHEGIAHAGGFEQGHEIGRQLGMKQERALWELAASTQEIEKWSEHQ